MYENVKRFREKLSSGRLCIGTGITFSDPAVTEALSPSVDFVWIDLEHNSIGTDSMLAHLIAARAGGAAALVRVPGSETSWIKRVLDSGAEGLIVPQVRSCDEVKQVVADSRYAPMGQRGYGPRRPSNYGRSAGGDYLREANETVFVVVQVENAAALSELDEIVGVSGLDSIVIGPYDLSASLGHPGEINHPKVADAVKRIIDRSREAGLFVGMGMLADPDYACRAAEMGVQWVQCGGDYSFLVDSVSRFVTDVRARQSE